MSEADKPLIRVLERMPMPALIASPVTGRILWVNRRLTEMYGVDAPGKLIGRTLLDFIQPHQVAKALADLALVVAGQSPPAVTYQLKRANGEYAAGQVSSVPLRFEDQPAMLSFVADVSERERLLRDLSESEQRYRSLLDAMPDGVVVVREDGRVAHVNRALAHALKLGSVAELMGRRFHDLVAPGERIAFEEARKRLLRTGESPPASPLTLVCCDGVELSATATSMVVRWEGEPATQTLMYAVGIRPGEEPA